MHNWGRERGRRMQHHRRDSGDPCRFGLDPLKLCYTDSRMPLTNFNISAGSHLLIDSNPVDGSGQPGSTDPGSGITYAAPAGITTAPTDNTGRKALVTVAADQPIGVYQVDASFKAIPFGPTLTSSFDVTVPENPAVALQFIADPVQP